MDNKRWVVSGAVAVALLTAAAVIAQRVGETVAISEPVLSDHYAAGRSVQVTAPVGGDLVLAGQELVVDGDIDGDLIAAGGSLELQGAVADDVRAAGGTIKIEAQVTGHVVAAGGEVVVRSDASIGDWAWLAGGSVIVEGKVGEELRVMGQSVKLSGEVGGDAVIAANDIQLEPNTVILGNLLWDGDAEPQIAESATVQGEIIQEDLRESFEDVAGFDESSRVQRALLFGVALTVSVLALFLAFPGVSGSVTTRVRSMPIRTLGLGFGVAAGIPLAIVLLFVTRVGWILALGLLVGYLLFLLCAMLFGVVSIGQLGLQLSGQDRPEKRLWSALAIALGAVLFLLVAQIPILGTAILMIVLLCGLGALSAEFITRYQRPAPGSAGRLETPLNSMQ